MKTLTMLGVLALLLAGCGPSADEVIEQRRAEAEPKLKQIEDVGTSAATYTGAAAPIKAPDKLTFSDGGNTGLVQVETFLNADSRKPQLDLILGSSWLESARKLLSQGAGSVVPEFVTSTFDSLAALKYLAIVRTTLYSDPVVMGEDSFSAGWWQGDVMLFEIESGKCLGRVELSAKNGEEVNVNMAEADKWLHSDLWSRARDALKEALADSTDGPVLK